MFLRYELKTEPIADDECETQTMDLMEITEQNTSNETETQIMGITGITELDTNNESEIQKIGSKEITEPIIHDESEMQTIGMTEITEPIVHDESKRKSVVITEISEHQTDDESNAQTTDVTVITNPKADNVSRLETMDIIQLLSADNPIEDQIKKELDLQETNMPESLGMHIDKIKHEIEDLVANKENEVEKSNIDEPDDHKTTENGLVLPTERTMEQSNLLPENIVLHSEERNLLQEETNQTPKESNFLLAEAPVDVPESEKPVEVHEAPKDKNALLFAICATMSNTEKKENNISKCCTLSEAVNCIIAHWKDVVRFICERLFISILLYFLL